MTVNEHNNLYLNCQEYLKVAGCCFKLLDIQQYKGPFTFEDNKISGIGSRNWDKELRFFVNIIYRSHLCHISES